jgi:3-oxoacyl-[acyl-carrier-protein] synthase II
VRRVVITGIGLASPIGNDLASVSRALQSGTHGVRAMPEWEGIAGLSARVAAPVDVDLSGLPRKRVRAMGRVALLSTYATARAIEDAGLAPESLSSDRTGLCYGSTQGSTADLEIFCRSMFEKHGIEGATGTSYLKFMSHTCAANLAQYFAITGRVVPTVAACASASQGIGLGYEMVAAGIQDVMLCGGAEELHSLHAAVFDLVYAASNGFNESPSLTPRPFDERRDGLVIGEGAGTVVLEELEAAKRRGAHIHAEVVGFGMSCDGTHVTAPSSVGMSKALRLSLESARLNADQIDYVNAHGTGTELGDIAESLATEDVFGSRIPFGSTKSYTGHTLGACGAIEAAFCVAMMRDGFLAPNRNLDRVDPRCGKVDYLMGDPRRVQTDVVMSNNFAFGGINTSLILRRA